MTHNDTHPTMRHLTMRHPRQGAPRQGTTHNEAAPAMEPAQQGTGANEGRPQRGARPRWTSCVIGLPVVAGTQRAGGAPWRCVVRGRERSGGVV